MGLKVRRFPDGFLWGVSTSAYQIEGATCVGGRGQSIWDAFCRQPGRILGGDNGDIACDHYNRFAEDVSLMAELGLPAYRFSVSWPRIIPQGRGPVNGEGLGFYDRLVDRLCAAGITPLVTLYHWDLPNSLQEQSGGWLDSSIAEAFADYAGMVFDRLGDRVKKWHTLNEPWCSAHSGYITGIHAPGVRDERQAYIVGHNLLRAHAHAVERYRQSDQGDGEIALALNMPYCYPASDSEEDVTAAERAMEAFGGWFGDPVFFGEYPQCMVQRLGKTLPRFTERERDLLRGSMDCLPLNYYTVDFVKNAPGNGAMETEVVPQPGRQTTEMGWLVDPEGFCKVLVWLRERYGSVPMYVAENGIALNDAPDEEGYVEDGERIQYLRDHIEAMGRAMDAGVDVRGYMVWSLMDNMEWSFGYDRRFGLVHCDRSTLKRTIKASGHWYAEFIRCGCRAE